MNKPNDYDSVAASHGGTYERETLPADAYVVRILSAVAGKNKNGGDALNLAVDICEGSYAGYFGRAWESKKRFDAGAWYPGTIRRNLCDDSGKTSGFFKGLIDDIEQSNPGYRWNWDERTLSGKLIGIMCREEEYENQRTGLVAVTTKIAYTLAAQKVRSGDYNVPARKTLQNALSGGYSGSSAQGNSYTASSANAPAGGYTGTQSGYNPHDMDGIGSPQPGSARMREGIASGAMQVSDDQDLPF